MSAQILQFPNKVDIINSYKGAIMDWCGHENALKHAAKAFRVPLEYVRKLVGSEAEVFMVTPPAQI